MASFDRLKRSLFRHSGCSTESSRLVPRSQDFIADFPASPETMDVHRFCAEAFFRLGFDPYPEGDCVPAAIHCINAIMLEVLGRNYPARGHAINQFKVLAIAVKEQPHRDKIRRWFETFTGGR